MPPPPPLSLRVENSPAAPRESLADHLAARGLLRKDNVPAALVLTRRWGCRLSEALIAQGAITPVELAEALAERNGLPFVDLITDPPESRLCRARDVDFYLTHLVLPWREIGDVLVVACAHPGPETRRLVAEKFGAGARLAITAKFDVIWTVQRLFREPLMHDAVYRLHERMPQFSARRVLTAPQSLIAGFAAIAIVASIAASPGLAATMLLLLLSVCYGANIVLRLVLFSAAGLNATGHRVSAEELAALDEAALPVFSILVPLYREAGMLPSIVAALRALDYPAAKLDIKLVLEEDDFPTIAAAKAQRLDGRFEIILVPVSTPRTKPKACNYALRFARGDYVVVYDAEDRPEADQLKKVAAAFAGAPPDLACFQARLNVYNPCDNWLTRMFALEYAAWFDFLLPGLGRLGIPVPLGGTSNHFRIEILRRVHGWDAFNVTEDADLGVRLARLGYRVLPIDSSTYEEAICGFRGWIRQRSRWLKGYMQTGLVHLRAPVAFMRTVGPGPFWGFTIFIVGAAATSLLSPVFWLLSFVLAWRGGESLLGPYAAMAVTASYVSLIAGNGLLTLLSILAPLKRRWHHLMPYGATVFLYWLLISVAAYRALWQLVTKPFYWEKTQHGARVAKPEG